MDSGFRHHFTATKETEHHDFWIVFAEYPLFWSNPDFAVTFTAVTDRVIIAWPKKRDPDFFLVFC